MSRILISTILTLFTAAHAQTYASDLVQFPPREKITPPETIFHWGKREHLLEDAKAGTVPAEIWDRFIMNGDTLYGLLPFRRGLYGVDHPGSSEQFGNWLMGIHLKDECRRPESIVIPSYLAEDERFIAWFAVHPNTPFKNLDDFKRGCFRKAGPKYEERLILKVQNIEPEDVAGREGSCEELIQSFYSDTGIKVVLDEQWRDQVWIEENIIHHTSWYIRDRGCIRGITGMPSEITSLLASVPDPWRSYDSPFLRSAEEGRFSLWIQALLTDSRSPTRDQMNYLKKSAKDSSIRWEINNRSLEMVGEIRLSNVVATVVESWSRCKDRGSLKTFEDLLRFYPKEITRVIGGDPFMNAGGAALSLTSRLNKICR